MKQKEFISANQVKPSGEAALHSVNSSRLKFATIPIDWDVSFPFSESLCHAVFGGGNERKFGVVVYRFSESEARFVLRGDLQTKGDLALCLGETDELATRLGCQEIVTQEKLRPDWLNAAKVFMRHGFEQLDESWIFECPFGPFVERLNRIMQALARSSSIPIEARVTNLTAGANLARALLDEASLMDGFDFDSRLRIGAHKAISEEYSQLVWVGQMLVGIILVAPTCDDGTFEVPIRYIIPAYRQTWVNALLIHSCVKRGQIMGATTIRFNANSKTHQETIRLAKQVGCLRIASSHRYGKIASQKNLKL